MAVGRWGRLRLAAGTTAQVERWGRLLATALGVAALAGAGQLGVAYGLGFVRFDRDFTSGGLWAAQQTWVVWCAVLAVLGGAAAAVWTARRLDLTLHLGGRIWVALAAGVGAAVVVPLTALPASAARLTGLPPIQPGLTTAASAVVGVILGILVAVVVLSIRLVAVSVTLLVALAWLLALVSALPALVPGADLSEVRLGVLDLPALGGGARSMVAVLSPPVLALLVCGSIAAAARSRGLSPLVTAVSSTAAPGLLAVVYLVGSPGTGDRALQISPYAGALLAVAAGLLVALVVGVARIPARRPARPVATGAPPATPPPTAAAAGEPAPAPTSPAPSSPAPFEPPKPPMFTPVEPPKPPQPIEPIAPPKPVAPPKPIEPVAPPKPIEPIAPPKPAEVPKQPPATPPPPVPAPDPPAATPAAATPAAATPAAATPAAATPAAATPPADKPTRRWGRKPKEPREPKPPTPPREPRPPKPPKEPKPPRQRRSRKEPAPPAAAPPAAAPSPAPAPEPAAPTSPAPPRTKRRGDDEHVDWISSLADQSDDDADLEPGKRRLRRDGDVTATG